MGAPLEAPARRRRHTRLIATATELVGECTQAAAAVYGPIADAPPEQERGWGAAQRGRAVRVRAVRLSR
ncbi:hypothetical protein GCM10009663_75830 [Kitasatospora arboriphila]|uniref:Uncharacterized protein n=1 Tax=Kitasatospora arboriphila TaxID=258052 RepID=A0ABN1U7K6_9ACTN